MHKECVVMPRTLMLSHQTSKKTRKWGGGGGNYLTRTDILHTHKHTYIYIYIYIVINKCVSSATQKENLRLKMTTQPIISTLDITEEPG